MADVTIRLTGDEYRTLCFECEYHEQDLRKVAKEMSAGPDKRAATERAARFAVTLEKVRA